MCQSTFRNFLAYSDIYEQTLPSLSLQCVQCKESVQQSKMRRSKAPVNCLFQILAAAVQCNKSQSCCGVTLFTSCLTGNTLHSPGPSLPVATAQLWQTVHSLHSYIQYVIIPLDYIPNRTFLRRMKTELLISSPPSQTCFCTNLSQ